MFVKKSLALGLIAAIGTSPAMAVFNLDAVTATGTLVGLETLDGNAVQAVGLVNYPDLINVGNIYDTTNALGITIPNTVTRYVRYDLTNAVFSVAPVASGTNMTFAVVDGGTAGAGYAVFSLVAGVGTVPTRDISLVATTSLAVNPAVTSTDSVNIKYRAYETLTGASSQGTALLTKAPALALVTFGSGITTAIAPTTLVNIADVNTDFKKFTAAAQSTTLANLGKANIAVTAAVDAVTGVTVSVANSLNLSTTTATITGDFGIATQVYGMSANANCSSRTNLTVNAAKTAATALTGTALIAKPFFCLAVGATNTVAIPKGSFTVAIDNKTAATTVINQPADKTAVIGSVAHNGTTVELPYLSTFASYNQRVYMVNRGAGAATYSMVFQPEAGVTAVAGTGATGTIPAGGTLSVKASDIVTLTGKTRVAATLNIVAASTNVSVATQQVNLSDKGTDTVTYK